MPLIWSDAQGNRLPGSWWSAPPAQTINSVETPTRERQFTLAAENAPIRYGYGRDLIGAQIVNVLPYQGSVVVQCLWGVALDSIERIYLNDTELSSGVTSYLGSQSSPDSTLVAAFAAQSITYADVLPGLSYSVLVLPHDVFSAGFSVSAVVEWRKVWDPRISANASSSNPALALADFIVNTSYGMGAQVDWTSVTAAADACDELVGGEKRRLIGWTCSDISTVAAVAETLRAYAGVYISRRGQSLRLVPDRPASSVAAYRHVDGQIAKVESVVKRDLSDAPTTVEIKYTDTSSVPWRERSAYASSPSETARRLSSVRLSGIHRYSQARREAIERLNRQSMLDMSASIVVLDAGIAHEPGDIVTVAAPVWGGDKLFRVTACESAGSGLWRLALTEYEPAAYSDAVESAPTYADTTLPRPDSPPDITGLTIAEASTVNRSGVWYTSVLVTWDAASWPFLSAYDVQVLDGATVVDASRVVAPQYMTAPLVDSRTYTVRVRCVGQLGVAGEWASSSRLVDGKLAPPPDVAVLTGFEAGGDVYLQWSAVEDLDIWRYEVRYGSTSATWTSAAVVDRIDGLRTVLRGVIPSGTWKFFVKAIDSVGNESANAASTTLTVTLDPDAMQSECGFTSPTLTAMVDFVTERGGITRWVTNPGTANDAFGTQFSSALATYTSPLVAYHTSATSVWQSETYDFGFDVPGEWNVDGAWQAITGAETVTISLKTSDGSWVDHTSLPVKASARYVKVKLETTSGTGTLLVEAVRVSVAATTKKEFGTIDCSASGTNTVTLQHVYSVRRRIVLTPIGTSSARSAVADAITFSSPTTFDVYLFDASGTRVAGQVAWAWEGI